MANSSLPRYDASISTPKALQARPSDAGDLKHHLGNGGGFTNPWDSWQDFFGPKIIGTFIWRMISGQANRPDVTPPTVPVHQPSFLQTRSTPRLRATWLGHAAFLVEFESGFRALFDPVFTERCSPFSFLGPKRYTKIPCQLEEIPAVDAVIISHNHYDHMSHPTMMKLKTLHPNAQFFVPLGNKQWCLDSGINNVTELDWWEERDIVLSNSLGNVAKDSVTKSADSTAPSSISARISCLPCQHTSARTPFDKGRTLWASWSVESGGKKVWFGGDTGYRRVPKLPEGEDDYGPGHDYPRCPAFKDIGVLRGPFDLGLIPIGAYHPRWMFSAMHANPVDAVNIFQDVRCKYALGIHWGTWVLTEEEVLEPPRILKKALLSKGLAETGVFDVCDIGESVEL